MVGLRDEGHWTAAWGGGLVLSYTSLTRSQTHSAAYSAWVFKVCMVKSSRVVHNQFLVFLFLVPSKMYFPDFFGSFLKENKWLKTSLDTRIPWILTSA